MRGRVVRLAVGRDVAPAHVVDEDHDEVRLVLGERQRPGTQEYGGQTGPHGRILAGISSEAVRDTWHG